MSGKTMNLTLRVWRQKNAQDEGRFETYEAKNISPDQSFLEMLDAVNEDLITAGKDPIAFDHDCREGICGMCSLVINGRAHGPDSGKTTCSLHMRRYKDGDTVTIEPFRAKAFPVLKDLVTDRGAFDRIIAAGGYTSVKTGSAIDANALPIPQENAELAMDAAACIGCGGCVAACPNASAMLFLGAKVSQMTLLPQGQPERTRRVLRMVETHDAEGFGNCTNEYECMKACPKEIHVSNIARLNREYLRATVVAKD
jgi:succinate dehydrogenase / fumarate reductase iron-sulfur subunit